MYSVSSFFQLLIYVSSQTQEVDLISNAHLKRASHHETRVTVCENYLCLWKCRFRPIPEGLINVTMSVKMNDGPCCWRTRLGELIPQNSSTEVLAIGSSYLDFCLNHLQDPPMHGSTLDKNQNLWEKNSNVRPF